MEQKTYAEKFINLFNRGIEVISEEKNGKNAISFLWYFLIIVGLVVGFKISEIYYQEYNFLYNDGMVMRTIKVLPSLIIVVWCCVYLVPKKIKSFSTLYWHFFLILSMIPLSIVFIFNGIAESKHVIIFIYVMTFVCVAGLYLIQRTDIRFPLITTNKKVFFTTLIIACTLCYLYLIHTLGIPKNIIASFKDVYGVRLSYRKNATHLDDYLIQWLGNVINPFLLAYTLKEKKYKLAFIPVFLEVVLYIYTAYKSLFAVLILAPFFAFVLSKGLRRKFLEFIFTAAIFFGLAMGFMGKMSLFLISVLRVFLWPAMIAMQYYDFYWMYPKMELSHSIFGRFINNPYGLEPAFNMSSLYYGKPAMRLNTTWYADSYCNFGIIGIIIFAVILFAILVVIKSLEEKDIYLVTSLLFGGIFALFNAPLLTTLLTHGLGIGIFLAYLLPKSKSAE